MCVHNHNSSMYILSAYLILVVILRRCKKSKRSGKEGKQEERIVSILNPKKYVHTYFIVTSPKGLFRNNDYITLFIITNYNT